MNKILSVFNRFKSTVYFEYLLMVAFGAMVACGLPPIQNYVFPVVGFLLAFHYMQQVQSKRRAVFMMAFLFLGYFLLSSVWLMNPFLIAEKFVAKLVLPLGVVGFLFASLVYALPFFFLPLFKKTITKTVVFAALFAISEWLRSFIFVGFGYNMLGSMWFDVPAIAQSASIFGVYGLTFFTVLVFIFPYLFYAEKNNLKKIFLPVSFLISLVSLFMAWGVWRLHNADNRFFDDKNGYVDAKKIRIVQPSINTVYEYIPSLVYKNTMDIKSLAMAKNVNDVVAVFLHETAIRSYLSNANSYQIDEAVGDIIPKSGYLVAGMPRIEQRWNNDNTEFGQQAFNSVIAFNSFNDVAGKYFKKKLVPFGEYIPTVFKMFLPDVITDGSGFDFPKYTDEQLIYLGYYLPKMSISLCNEDGHAGQFLRYDLKNDVGAIVNIANISWFGLNSGAAMQNYAYAVMRAIEEGLPNIRVVNRGISGVISPYGRMVEGDVVIVDTSDYKTVLFEGRRDRIMPDEAGIIDVRIPTRIYKTFYSMVGNYFVISALMLIIFMMLFFDRKKKRDTYYLVKNKFSLSNFFKISMTKEDVKFLSGYVVAFLFGAFMVLSAPPFDLFFPAVVSVLAVYFIFEKYRNKSFFAILILMFLFFYGYFFFGSSWLTGPMGVEGIHNSFNRYAIFFRWFLPFIVASGACLFFPFIAKIKNSWLRFLTFAVAFALGEWTRSQSFWATGFPFITLGEIWIPVKPILQFVSLFGIHGLSFITVFFILSFKVFFTKQYRYIVFPAFLFLITFLWGANQIKENNFNPDLNLRLVQSMKDRRLDDDTMEYTNGNVNRVINVANYERPKDTNLVVMSESVFPYNLVKSDFDLTYNKEEVEVVKKAIPKNGYLI
ncbi:MAG: apolipoprotein N-acyltransferase, partial [Rickettsiales bacterium]|nr:apolipoprotein N-acyltransferase [Rickettsiales bacterium]